MTSQPARVKTPENTPGNTLGYTYLGLQSPFEYRRKETIFTSKPAQIPRNKDWTEAEVEYDKLNDFDSIRKKLPWTKQPRHPHVDGETTKYIDHIILNVDRNFVF